MGKKKYDGEKQDGGLIEVGSRVSKGKLESARWPPDWKSGTGGWKEHDGLMMEEAKYRIGVVAEKRNIR